MSTPDPAELQPRELLQIAANFFESHRIAYRVVGSMASIAEEWKLVQKRVDEASA